MAEDKAKQGWALTRHVAQPGNGHRSRAGQVDGQVAVRRVTVVPPYKLAGGEHPRQLLQQTAWVQQDSSQSAFELAGSWATCRRTASSPTTPLSQLATPGGV